MFVDTWIRGFQIIFISSEEIFCWDLNFVDCSTNEITCSMNKNYFTEIKNCIAYKVDNGIKSKLIKKLKYF